MIRAAIVLALCASAAIARADTHRIAIVVGNNAGASEQPLHFAETDAGKIARVLVELGGVSADDLFLLQGRDLAALTDTFAQVRQRIAAYRRDPASRVILFFYFSGHSDGEALELGRDRLEFRDLRRTLAAVGADVRVALVDSCKSGALFAVKGGTRGPAFQIRLSDELASSGEVLLTSSAANEVALESREIGGSFFTHHFVSGLRGAADTSGDGEVTLAEAYQYAYAHTLATTGATLIGPQHPGFDYELSGQGELVLTELTHTSATLELPKGFARALVIQVARDQVVAELTSDVRPVIAVEPGRYAVRAWRADKVVAGRVEVAAGEHRVVRWDELATTSMPSTASKGPAVQAEPADAARPTFFVAASAGTGVADGIGVVPGLRAGLALASGWSIAITGASRHHASFRETTSAIYAGYRLGIARGRLAAWAGLDAGAGIVVQTPILGSTASSGEALAGPELGASIRITRELALVLAGQFSAAALERDGKLALVPLPSGWLGISASL